MSETCSHLVKAKSLLIFEMLQELVQIYYCPFCGEEYENKVNLNVGIFKYNKIISELTLNNLGRLILIIILETHGR